jgi:hypothetical protein
MTLLKYKLVSSRTHKTNNQLSIINNSLLKPLSILQLGNFIGIKSVWIQL